MIRLYLKLVLIFACLQAGISLINPESQPDRRQIQKIEEVSRQEPSIDWKPISVLPEGAKKFQ